MNSFLTSTHNKKWIKTEKQLKKLDDAKYKDIKQRINDINELIEKENKEIPNVKDHKKGIARVHLPSKEEEKTLIINYSNLLIKIINSFPNASTSLKNYTVSYYRRFYLIKSILDYDPSYLMAAAFYLGTKIAAINFSEKDFLKIFPVMNNNLDILNEYEFFLCTELDYDFFVYDPFQALFGFIYTLEQKGFFLNQNKDNYINQDDFKNGCMNIIDRMFLTDNIFLYTYSEIALGSIIIECENKNINIINIGEILNLDKIINIKEFFEKKVFDMKKKLEEIPKYENPGKEIEKAQAIHKKVKCFWETFPQYNERLNMKRNDLKAMMAEFEKNFIEKENSMAKE